jgi:hypothetical protein
MPTEERRDQTAGKDRKIAESRKAIIGAKKGNNWMFAQGPKSLYLLANLLSFNGKPLSPRFRIAKWRL